ncbi:MAG: hypothetical protein OXL41_01155 [Nitrospinae bacterium]|nr:hypothetical protein [Nitrospinota bacterium]
MKRSGDDFRTSNPTVRVGRADVIRHLGGELRARSGSFQAETARAETAFGISEKFDKYR